MNRAKPDARDSGRFEQRTPGRGDRPAIPARHFLPVNGRSPRGAAGFRHRVRWPGSCGSDAGRESVCPTSLPVIAGPLAQTAAPPAGGAGARACKPIRAGPLSWRAWRPHSRSRPARRRMPALPRRPPPPLSPDSRPKAPRPPRTRRPRPRHRTRSRCRLAPFYLARRQPRRRTRRPQAPRPRRMPADLNRPTTPIRPPSKPATGPTRGGRLAATEPDPITGAVAPDPATPAGVEPVASTAPLPVLAASSTPPGDAHRTGHPAEAATGNGAPPTAAPRNEGPSRTDREPTHTTPQDQTAAAPTSEAPLGAPDAAPTRSQAETATDPRRPRSALPTTLLPPRPWSARWPRPVNPPASPAGRATPVSQPTAEPPRAEIASPAEQIAAPLVALGSGPDQSRRMTVRLDPAALGAVQVRIERPRTVPRGSRSPSSGRRPFRFCCATSRSCSRRWIRPASRPRAGASCSRSPRRTRRHATTLPCSIIGRAAAVSRHRVMAGPGATAMGAAAMAAALGGAGVTGRTRTVPSSGSRRRRRSAGCATD